MDELQPRKIMLFPLAQLTTEVQLKVRDMRNDLDVRKWMYTDHLIGLNEHLGWIDKIKGDDKQIVFVIMDEDHCPLGVASVNDIDPHHKRAKWAYYLTKHARGGLGSAVEYALINFIFDKLDMQKLNCEVIEGNDLVVNLHKKFLFQEEGFRRSHIFKEGKYIGVHLLGLTREDWHGGREKLFETYKHSLNKFALSIKWDAVGGDQKKHPLDEISSARARNNLNWMSILRLVLELSPDVGKELVKEIRSTDKEISELTDKLISL